MWHDSGTEGKSQDETGNCFCQEGRGSNKIIWGTNAEYEYGIISFLRCGMCRMRKIGARMMRRSRLASPAGSRSGGTLMFGVL